MFDGEEIAAFTACGRGSSPGVFCWSNSGIPESTSKRDQNLMVGNDRLVSIGSVRFSHIFIESMLLLLRLTIGSGFGGSCRGSSEQKVRPNNS
jgi:hypothetical protein